MSSGTSNFANLRVAALESRNAVEMGRLIEKFGGQPFVSPSMREVAIQENRDAIDFANRLITGEIDTMIFLTGVGFRHLLKAIEKHVPRERFLPALADMTTICRGPKPVVKADLLSRRVCGLSPTNPVRDGSKPVVTDNSHTRQTPTNAC